MGEHTICGEVCDDLLGLKQKGGLFEHFVAEGLGQVLALGVYLGLERVGLGEGGFAQGLGEEAVAVEDAEVTLEFAALGHPEVELGVLVGGVTALEVYWVYVIYTYKAH